MKAETKIIWTQFRTALCKALDATPDARLREAWKSGPDKTVFYERTLMPAVAGLLGYDLQIERHRCDYAFLNADKVPLVFAESENAHGTASHEIHHLCSLAAPLKVLLISCDWEATEKKAFLPIWSQIIRTHHAVVTMDCIYAIIVGGWDGEGTSFAYSFTVLDSSGLTTEELTHLVKSVSE